MQVVFEKVEGGQLPTYAHDNDACIDLYARTGGAIKSGEVVLIPAGFKVAVPDNHAMFIYSRSGLALQRLVVNNAPGVIDPGYRGEVKVQIRNDDIVDWWIVEGERIAQAAIQETPHIDIIEGELDATERGENGFGSTGQ